MFCQQKHSCRLGPGFSGRPRILKNCGASIGPNVEGKSRFSVSDRALRLLTAILLSVTGATVNG